jgi:hypothetical protein
MDWLDELYGTLDKRATAEQVAAIIKNGAPREWFTRRQRDLLAQAQPWYSYGSFMLDDFQRPPAADRPLAAVQRFFPDYEGEWPSPDDPEGMLFLVDKLGEPLGWCTGCDWKTDRRDHNALKAAGIKRRQYNRSIRALRHLTEKATRMQTALKHRRLILIGRSGFACDITRQQFRADPDAAMFIAYWVARKNRRRLFSLSGRENPMDKLAEALLARCTATGAGTDWPMIAMVCTGDAALRWLSDFDRGELAGEWSKVMRDTASRLQREWYSWAGAAIKRRDQMIVRRGMDSSGWNELAQAYNAARAGWLAASVAVSPDLITPCLPGKAMRLMAADLAAWHRSSGGDVDPDTFVWANLPLPWQVLDGTMPCSALTVEHWCREAGIDAMARGWTAMHATRESADFKPTPELVHGVEISDPLWAAVLRRAGVFAGPSKRAAEDAGLLRDQAEQAGVVTGKLPTREEIAAGYDKMVE